MSAHLRRIGALLVLLAGTVGAPIAMWVISRDLLPDRVPSPAAMWAALTSPDSGGRLLASVMLVGAFIAWVVFTVCVLLEVGGRISRRPALRLPGLRLPQTAVAGLISVILAGTVSVAGAATAHGQDLVELPRATTATAVAAAAATHVPVQTKSDWRTSTTTFGDLHDTHAQDQDQAVVGGPVWVVQRGDTAWSIADKALGDPTRWREIVFLNEGRTQADGRALRDGEWLEIGWRLTLPAGAAGNTIPAVGAPAAAAASAVVDEYVVRKGDTLSAIARDTLGDESRYVEIAEDNAITDPDRIDVGQKLRLPAAGAVDEVALAAAGAPVVTDAPAVEEAPAVDEAPVVDEPLAVEETPTVTETPAVTDAPAVEAPAAGQTPADVPTEQAPAPAPSATPAASAPVVSPPATAPTPTSTTTPSTPIHTPSAASSAAADTAAAATSDSDEDGISTPIGVGLSLALAGAAWAALLAARRRQSRRRPAGQTPAAISPAAGKLARRLREGATSGQVVWMDTALRYAAAAAAQRDPARLPDVTSVWLSATELQLQLAAPVPAPAPFVAEESSWMLPAGTDLPDLEWVELSAPFPALASLGHADGETLLVDLERVGSLSIHGSPARTSELFNHLAAEFAHNQWCDDLRVTLVGWGADLVALNPTRVRHVTGLAEVVTDIRGRIAETVQLQRDLDTTVLVDRVAGDGRDIEDPWAPEVLLIQADADAGWDDLAQVLAAITGHGRSTVAVVARHHAGSAAPITGSAVLTIDDDGTLTLPAVIGDLRVRAAGLNQHAVDELLEVFTATERFQRPGPAQQPQPWARDMDTAGGLLTPTPAPAQIQAASADPDVADQTPTDAEATAAPVAQAAAEMTPANETREAETVSAGGRVVPLRGAEAAAALEHLAVVLDADPTLDADVAEWHDPVVRRPRISVLGPAPTVVAGGRRPANRITRFTEISVYLAVHPQISAQQLTEDLWPGDVQPSGEARRADISLTRTWMGRDADGMKYLPDARKKPYELTRLLDVELFKRLRKRADARRRASDKTGAITDLTEAMRLIRDCPIPALDQVGSGYAWLDTSDPASLAHAAVAVISAGSELVDLALDNGDLDLAKETAERMHQVDPAALVPLCDLIRTAHRAGDRAAARNHVRRVLVSAELEYIEDLPPEVFEVVNGVFPEGLAV